MKYKEVKRIEKPNSRGREIKAEIDYIYAKKLFKPLVEEHYSNYFHKM